MFYSQFILAKKGPLGTIWIAAHLERKLRKNQVADTDIAVSVDSILFPDVPIALRLSSHLLLGVVRIYSKQVGYLFDDCSDALLKVKQAFRSTAVDLPPEESTAPYHSITLPETFDLDDFELPPDTTHFVDHHLTSTDLITLQDPPLLFSTSHFGLDERFGDGDTSGLDLIDQLENADTTGHAQAPSTPVMAEEPNLSSAQEVSVCDDHQELEEEPNLYHIHPTLACKDHQDSEDCSTAKLSTAESSDLYSGKVNMLIDVNSAAVSDDQKTYPMSDLLSPGWNPFSEDHEAMSPTSEYPDGVNGGLQNEGINNEATDQVGPKTIEIDQLSLEPQDSNGVDDVENLGKSFHLSDSLPSNIESPSKSYPGNAEIFASEEWNDPKITSFVVHEKHLLLPCKHLNQPSATSPESNVPVAPHLQSGVPEIYSEEASERNEESRVPDWSLEFQVNQSEFCNLNDQHDNGITVEPQLDIPNANEISELPAPENLLSLPRSYEKDQVHLLESTPNGEHLVIGNEDDTGTNIISGKKRTFTESTLTVDSLNSIDTLGVVQSKRTRESVPDDNDLLSSILVGSASFLKLKPTPPPQRTSKKRPRSTTRIGSSKRKVIVDDTMVLNGDQIRQQLTHTGDIRRIRKKAPCTRAEIWMIQKEYLVEEIFTEPVFTGVSSVLASIYSQAYDLSDIKLSQNETQVKVQEAICNDISVHVDTNLDIETEEEVNHESIPVRRDMEVQSPERQEDKTTSENLPLGHFEEISEMHSNEKIESTADAINPTIVNEAESTFLIDPASVDKVDGPTGFVDLSNGVQFDPSETMPNQTLETQFVEVEASLVDTSSEKVIDATVGGMDSRASDEFQLEGAEVDFSVANEANVMNGEDSEDRFLVTYPDQGMEGVSKNELGVVKEARNLEFEVDGAHPIVYDLGIEPAEEATAHHVESLNSDAKGASVFDNEHPDCGNLNFQKEMDPENAFVDYNAPIEHGDFEYNMDEHDTGFLNEDDDEVAEEAEDCAPSADHIGFIDNSGWSSRTRAVAKYLQVLFDKETEQGRKALPINNLLIGKTRKEASRMFFEALVLKTRDYIHLEQEAPFGNINMKPGVKLMKADF